ncbi:hypothetical protein SNE40_001596 [Patella caerulea]|uniref:Uncharacterized protein n=1 Tax=Patella caerulea TaxID=87958 RepID=A0AAN8KJ25_PATCE
MEVSLFLILSSVIVNVIVNPVCGFTTFNPATQLEGEFINPQRLSRYHNSTTTTNNSLLNIISEFYSDKNNVAMYLVLPIIVSVYGGCCVFYCLHKLKRYIHKQRSQPLSAESEESPEDDQVPESRNWTQYRKPVETREILKRYVPRNFLKPTLPRGLTDITQPSHCRPLAPISHVESLNNSTQNRERNIFRPSNRDLIEAALRPSLGGEKKLSLIDLKDELLTRFDTLSTFRMSNTTAEILQFSSSGDGNKENVIPKKKIILIAE